MHASKLFLWFLKTSYPEINFSEVSFYIQEITWPDSNEVKTQYGLNASINYKKNYTKFHHELSYCVLNMEEFFPLIKKDCDFYMKNYENVKTLQERFSPNFL
jgi:hypothetical protein